MLKIIHKGIICKAFYALAVILLSSGMQNQAVCQTNIIQDTVQPAKPKPKALFKDSLDGAFDVSDFLINAHGFIPIPMLITEPALGHFGGLLAAVFMQPPKHVEKKEGHYSPARPTIMGAGGMYTANNSWGIGGGYTSEWQKLGLIYSFAAAYGDINMDLYHHLPTLDKDIHATFNFNVVPVFLSARKNFGGYFSAGLKYMFCYTDVSLSDSDTIEGHSYFNQQLQKIESKSIISRLSPVITFDSRDNMFSPNDGLRVDAQLDWSDKILGSDYEYLQVGVEAYGYKRFFKPWVASLRLEWEQMFENPAFYMLPEIMLRGVPAYRYQGNITALAETEHRFTVYKRWAVVGFAGLGKAFETYSKFSDADWVYNYGGGVRYLLARKFNLQMGADVGFGPSDWGFYIVFGSSWMRE